MVFTGLEGLEARITPAAAHPIIDLAVPGTGNPEELPNEDIFELGGDFNGDGFEDWVYGENVRGNSRAYGWVVFGDGTDTRPNVDLAALDGKTGFKIITNGDVLSHLGAADVNGDGLDDLVMFSRYFFLSRSTDTLAVIPGSSDGFASVIDLTAEGRGGAWVQDYLTFSSASISFLGDVNADGTDDLAVVSADFSDSGMTGQDAIILWGSPGDSIAPLKNFTIISEDHFRFDHHFDRISIGGIGDFNADGADDFAVNYISIDYNTGESELFTWVFLGGSEPLDPEILLSGEPLPYAPLVFHDTNGIASSLISNTVEIVPVGDTNGDGFDDFVVSGAGVGSQANAIGTLILGSGLAETLPPSLVELTGRGYGLVSISGAGDVNGDGLSDIVLSGASLYGTLNILFGSESLPDRIRVDGLSGLSGFKITHSQGGIVSFSEAGDFNGDGIGDLKLLVSQPADSTSRFEIVYGAEDVAPPQVAFKNGRTAAFTDPNGDLVTIKVNKGSLSRQNFLLVAEGEGYRLAQLNLSDPQFDGASVKITAKASKSAGDGSTIVDSIFAGDVDLKTVSVDGHLGSIFAGNQDLDRPGLAVLKLGSLGGRDGLLEDSIINGGLTNLRVDGSVENARIHSMNAGIGSIRIGESLLHSIIAATDSTLAGDKRAGMKKILIGGDMADSQILTDREGGNIGSVKVGGDWARSNLLAGQLLGHVFSTTTNYFGSTPWNPLNASIGKIQIGGVLVGTPQSGDFWGFRATSIDGFKLGSLKIALEDGMTLPVSTGDIKVDFT